MFCIEKGVKKPFQCFHWKNSDARYSCTVPFLLPFEFAVLQRVSIAHCQAVKVRIIRDTYTANNILNWYMKCKDINHAHYLFNEIHQRDSVTWNSMITGYVNQGNFKSTWEFLKTKKREGFTLDQYTYGSILKGIACEECLDLGQQVHALISKTGYAKNVFSGSALLDMYAKCKRIEDAYAVFQHISERNLVSWNAAIAGYAQIGDRRTAFWLLYCMEREGLGPDEATLATLLTLIFDGTEGARDLVMSNSVLAAYVLLDCGTLAIELFIRMLDVISAYFEKEQQSQGKSQIVSVSNSLIVMYLKFNDKSMEDALKHFHFMVFKDRMRTVDLETDYYTLSVVLRSCVDLATLQLGQQVQCLAFKSGFDSNDYVASSLTFMYSKCGVITDTRKSFEATNKDNSITWNSIIFGYAQHGQGEIALDLFSEMQEKEVKPDHITFVAILTACSHIGLAVKGSDFLKSMEADYEIFPRIEHYACGVDLFGRAGHLDEAKALIKSMPFEPDAMVWMTLLGACRLHGDIELASEVGRHLLALKPEEHCTYLILSNMYGRLERWVERATIKKVMRGKGVRKVPGWSWIEVKNKVHAFNVEDHSHPQCEEIYQKLGELMDEIQRLGSIADVECEMYDLDYAWMDSE
ncbi:hypothetical protein NE237_031481 [Protea cynaroides]|uniref:Pentatricopeptide repeat-containing protein n=1 Tax=Protea cynaroides TaxID=273540 RepID=A0A9Q0L1K9_9MAGN|nr:hypothetical protein NE237_031481 [Protea cynaroides]